MPLEICPGRRVWQRHRNREYLVFVDESFYRFFGFNALDGNFCHGALGIPRDNDAPLQAKLQPLVRAYKRQVRRATGQEPTEIKYSVLGTLPLSFRMRFARELVRAFVDLGGFVAGFYSSTRGTIMERVRSTFGLREPFSYISKVSIPSSDFNVVGFFTDMSSTSLSLYSLKRFTSIRISWSVSQAVPSPLVKMLNIFLRGSLAFERT